MDQKSVDQLSATKKTDADRGKSKLHSPHPARKKFMTEILAAIGDGRLTFAQAARLEKRKLKQITEYALIQLKFGRFLEARKLFEVLTFLDNKNPFYRLGLGGAYQKLGKDLDASYQYTQCLKLSPNHTNALVNRGELFLRHKNFKKAAQDFREAILSDKTGRDKYANRARSLVIAIKRQLAKQKGDSNATKLPDSPIKRKPLSPFATMYRKPKEKKFKVK